MHKNIIDSLNGVCLIVIESYRASLFGQILVILLVSLVSIFGHYQNCVEFHVSTFLREWPVEWTHFFRPPLTHALGSLTHEVNPTDVLGFQMHEVSNFRTRRLQDSGLIHDSLVTYRLLDIASTWHYRDSCIVWITRILSSTY